MPKLPLPFYRRSDTCAVARELLGKHLVTQIGGIRTAGLITETEAYLGATDQACHGRHYHRTPRNEHMFWEGGIAYVYICYGIHHLFNIVTHEPGEPHAVLIRAIQPVEGVEAMMKRRNYFKPDKRLSSGPGSLSVALGITTPLSGISLTGKQIWIEDKGIQVSKNEIVTTTRIGVESAGADAQLPYRFYLKDNHWVSKRAPGIK
jgi:DNA-3-methyladenine glycosylase